MRAKKIKKRVNSKGRNSFINQHKIKMKNKKNIKVFIGGLVIGSITGAILGGLAIANVMAIAFINAGLLIK
jgi:hypothetical protein